MLDYTLIVNKEENYISLENKKNIILLDFKNQVISKKERNLNGQVVDFTIQEILHLADILVKVCGGEYGR